MTPTVYPAAEAAALRIHSHFARHLTDTHLAPDKEGTLPDALTLAAIIDAAFWASLRREEGYSPRISLAFVAPDQVVQPLTFERSLPLAPQPLTKMAAAAERPGIHLCVWREQGELRVWGATRNLPALCFVLEVIAPGHLVIKQSRTEESGKFINVAVLQGDEIKIIDPRATAVPDCPALLSSLLRLESRFAAGSDINVLIQLAVSMRAHGRGGTLLVTPNGSQEWKQSILQPITYSVVPPFSALADLLQNGVSSNPTRHWEEALARAVDGIAGLTAVDGATLITEKYELLAFGAKIVRRPGHSQAGRVIVTEPIEDAKAIIAEPTQLGGTRHLSAVQFVNDQRDAIALVASQDGRFTVFAWSSCEEMVHAHRIDMLLL